MQVGLSTKYCIFFNVDQINQWYLSYNKASYLPIYFEQIQRATKKSNFCFDSFLDYAHTVACFVSLNLQLFSHANFHSDTY